MIYLENHVYKFSEEKNWNKLVVYYSLCTGIEQEGKEGVFDDLFATNSDELSEWHSETFFGNTPSAQVEHLCSLSNFTYQYPEFFL